MQFGVAVLESIVDGPAQKRAQDVARDIERLSVLVEDLLTFLRSEVQPDALSVECFSLSRFLEDMVLMEYGNAGANLCLHLPDGDEIVYTDQKCVQQAAGNALRNAIRYAGKDGPVDVTLESARGNAVIRVEDQGAGVKEEELPHLAEPPFLTAKERRRCVEPGDSEMCYPSSSPARRPGRELAWASMAVADCVNTCLRMNCVISPATSASEMRDSEACRFSA